MERIHTEQSLSLYLTESYKGVTKTNLNILPGSQESFSFNELYEKSKKFEDELRAEENEVVKFQKKMIILIWAFFIIIGLLVTLSY